MLDACSHAAEPVEPILPGPCGDPPAEADPLSDVARLHMPRSLGR